MRYAILSDIHANPFALRAALLQASRAGATSCFCLGDLVGYHALPHETLDMIRRCKIPCVAGNHDQMASHKDWEMQAGPLARSAMRLTRRLLRSDEIVYLVLQPAERRRGDVLFVHSLPWSTEERLVTAQDFADAAARLRESHPAVRVCFTGHTHVARVTHVAPDSTVSQGAEAVQKLTRDGGIWFVNPGSVGLPRDGSDGACYAIYDDVTHMVEFHCAQYDTHLINAADFAAGLGTHLPEHALLERALKGPRAAAKRLLSAWA